VFSRTSSQAAKLSEKFNQQFFVYKQLLLCLQTSIILRPAIGFANCHSTTKQRLSLYLAMSLDCQSVLFRVVQVIVGVVVLSGVYE
jgi:hypothetical protein